MGMIHIYCGDGKGKTTAALGLAVRAAGAGKRVRIVQFLKGRHTSELEALKHVPGISVSRCDRDYGFTSAMSDGDRSDIAECHNRMFSEAAQAASDGECDMLVLDELCGAYNCGLIDSGAVDSFISRAPDAVEIVITGRSPCELFVRMADYISEIKNVRHPYSDRGTPARRGIEY